jgi:hypothetical protein
LLLVEWYFTHVLQLLLGTAVDIAISNHATSANVTSWSFMIAAVSCPRAEFSETLSSFVVS